MRVYFHKDFKKWYTKLRKSEQKKFDVRLALFMKNPFDPLLYNHELHGKYKELRSINVSGDLRALYKPLGNDTAFFILINTHGNLYH